MPTSTCHSVDFKNRKIIDISSGCHSNDAYNIIWSNKTLYTVGNPHPAGVNIKTSHCDDKKGTISINITVKDQYMLVEGCDRPIEVFDLPLSGNRATLGLVFKSPISSKRLDIISFETSVDGVGPHSLLPSYNLNFSDISWRHKHLVATVCDPILGSCLLGGDCLGTHFVL